LLHAFDGRDMPDHGWVQLGKDIATWEQDVVIIGSIGMTGYHAGPDKYIADVYGLADPLFARMPALYKPGNRPGHYSRAILQNYDESLRLKENFIVDPAAHDWLQKMWRITRAPLFSMKRLLLIWRLNLGIDKGQDLSHFRIPYNKDLSLPLADTSAIAMIHNMGVRFTFPAHQPGTKLGFTFRDGKALNVAWMKGKQPIGGEELTEHGSHALEIPNEADAVVLFPDNDWPHTWIANVVTF
jgi:hypothetical protein